MKPQQLQALKQLERALAEASDCGLLDDLQADINNPDSINDVCDTVAFRVAFIDFVSDHIAEFNCVPSEFEFNGNVYGKDAVWYMAEDFGLTKDIRNDQA